MAQPPGFVLEPRILDESDNDWIERFAVGEHWWDHEITDFLRQDALEQARQGLNRTILFSFKGYKEIVGFLTSSTSSLTAASLDEVLELPPGVPAKVPAVLIAYLGVARKYQRVGHFGQEMHLQLLEDIAGSWAAARVVYAECWEENEGGLEFWMKMQYVQFSRFQLARPDTGAKDWLRRMVYDRFAIRQ